MLQLQAPENLLLDKPSPREVPLYIRLLLGVALAILGFSLSHTVIFREIPLFGVTGLADFLVSILMALFGFYLLPKTFSSIKHWFQRLVFDVISAIVSAFWDQQTSRMREARRARDMRKKQAQLAEKDTLHRRLKGSFVLDTSILIDGRIQEVVRAGFIRGPLVIPSFVVDELQTLADSKDSQKRRKGRRGLSLLRKLKKDISVHILDVSIPPEVLGQGVDKALLYVADVWHLVLMTLDFNLVQVAHVQNLRVANLNDLANALRPKYLPGDILTLHIQTVGQNSDQGVGYLDDGTMVVVDSASSLVGEQIPVKIKKSLQGSAGKMYFAKLVGSSEKLSL